jgi:ElaB/YqjD/DUF883 family membrane-anchored ribosome-binding protein
MMFQPRSSEFESRVSAIVNHLRAIEKELNTIGRRAGRGASESAAAAGSQIAEVIGPILNELGDRFRRGQRVAADEAVSLGNEAVRIGSRLGNNAMAQVASQARQRPLLTLAVAIGVGFLIGASTRRL